MLSSVHSPTASRILLARECFLIATAITGACATSVDSPKSEGAAGASGSSSGQPSGGGPGSGGVAVGGVGGAGVVGPGSSDGGPSGAFGDGVDVHLTRIFDAPKTISFGLPVTPHAVSDAGTVRVSAS